MFIFLTLSPSQGHTQNLIWPDGCKIAVSLSYDDALESQLDNAVPALNRHNIKASFYVLPNSQVMNSRMEEWRSLADNGHELGNHSLYHPCRASLPDRDWVPSHHDLDKYTITQIVEEIRTANTFLKALDRKEERTFTPPCGDNLAGGEEYFSKVKNLFVAIKGQGVEHGFSVLWTPTGVTGDEMINYVKNVPIGISLINIVFHGVSGDYFSVTSMAHEKLLAFLATNRDTYYTDSYIHIMKIVNNYNISNSDQIYKNNLKQKDSEIGK